MGFLDSYLERAQENEHSPVNHWAELANRAVCLLEEIREGITADEPGEINPADFQWVIETDGSGDGGSSIRISAGVTLRLISVAYQIPDGDTPSGYLAFYRNVESGTMLLKVLSISELADESFSEGLHVAQNSDLLIVVRGGPADSQVAGRLGCVVTQHGPKSPTTHGGTN